MQHMHSIHPSHAPGLQAVGSSAAPNGGTTNVQLQLLNNQLGALNLQAQAQHQVCGSVVCEGSDHLG